MQEYFNVLSTTKRFSYNESAPITQNQSIMINTKIVIGLAYGDEGKGITTDYLCKNSNNPLVIRFSGGHQAGHTVVLKDGTRHVFSSFGAGTLRGVPTYWSKYCTFYPLGFFNELAALLEKGIEPKIYLDALALVTTPYDIFYNKKSEKVNQHGSCGLGFGATVTRDKSSPYKLYAQDLFYPKVLELKLNAIKIYYQKKTNSTYDAPELNKMMEVYLKMLEDIKPYIDIVNENEFFNSIIKKENFSDLIFEGSQGILLDMDHGFFPNVTYANTTSKNAMEIINKYHLKTPDIYYITRAYQTRHGNGFLSNEKLSLNYTANPKETNQYNPWQGHQRCTLLDLDMLDYALGCDANYSFGARKNLVVTCLDQINGDIQITRVNQPISYMNTRILANSLSINFDNILESWGDCSDKMK
jgi:adenylosuccinate synthase